MLLKHVNSWHMPQQLPSLHLGKHQASIDLQWRDFHHAAPNESTLDWYAGKGKEILALPNTQPTQRITYHAHSAPLHKIRTDDMLPNQLLTPFQVSMCCPQRSPCMLMVPHRFIIATSCVAPLLSVQHQQALRSLCIVDLLPKRFPHTSSTSFAYTTPETHHICEVRYNIPLAFTMSQHTSVVTSRKSLG